jgi:hypothetical protein
VILDGSNNELGSSGARIGRGIPYRLVFIRSAWGNNTGCYCSDLDGNSGDQIRRAKLARICPDPST